jgi:hypothetical protein
MARSVGGGSRSSSLVLVRARPRGSLSVVEPAVDRSRTSNERGPSKRERRRPVSGFVHVERVRPRKLLVSTRHAGRIRSSLPEPCDDVADAPRHADALRGPQRPRANASSRRSSACSSWRACCVRRRRWRTRRHARGAGGQMEMRGEWARSSGVIERPIDAIVVEDHEDTRELIGELLRMNGCVARSDPPRTRSPQHRPTCPTSS